MERLPIPHDWTEADGHILFMVCVPNSTLWRATVRGQIHNLTRGRVWDERTGRIKDVQKVGWEIYDSLMSCKLDELVAVLNQQGEKMDALVAAVQAVAKNTSELEDDLANVWAVLQSITTVLGGEVPQPPEPLKRGE